MREIRTFGALCLAVAGCQPPTTSEAPSSVSSFDATDAAVGSSAQRVEQSPAPPPSGFYDRTADVVSDDCTPHIALPPAGRYAVMAQVGKQGPAVNVPLDVSLRAGSPDNGVANSSARMDLLAARDFGFTTTMHPAAMCHEYTVTRTVKVTDVSHDRFRVDVNYNYGATTGCSPAPTPASCAIEFAETFRLVEAKCEARCNTRTAFGDGGIEMSCQCP
jgi:hypothetical protein